MYSNLIKFDHFMNSVNVDRLRIVRLYVRANCNANIGWTSYMIAFVLFEFMIVFCTPEGNK